MPGLSIYTEGGHVIVAREAHPHAVQNYLWVAGGLGGLAFVLWMMGVFSGHWEPWTLVVAAVAVAAATPFALKCKDVRFDRQARMLTVVTTTPRGERRREIPFARVVEVRAVYYSSRNANGYHLEVQLENFERVRLNSTPALESVALGWMGRLHGFIGGRPTGEEPHRMMAFALPS
jgi:hypothetical protein